MAHTDANIAFLSQSLTMLETSVTKLREAVQHLLPKPSESFDALPRLAGSEDGCHEVSTEVAGQLTAKNSQELHDTVAKTVEVVRGGELAAAEVLDKRIGKMIVDAAQFHHENRHLEDQLWDAVVQQLELRHKYYQWGVLKEFERSHDNLGRPSYKNADHPDCFRCGEWNHPTKRCFRLEHVSWCVKHNGLRMRIYDQKKELERDHCEGLQYRQEPLGTAACEPVTWSDLYNSCLDK